MIVLSQRYTYMDICMSLQLMAGCYEEIGLCRTAGYSQDGRRIPLFRLGLGRRNLICTGGIHGREGVNPVLLLRMIEDYGQAFRFNRKIAGCDVRSLLKEYAILFLPLVNPDGYEIARAGFSTISNPLYRKTARESGIPHKEWKYNARGIDINRNFPCQSYIQRQLREYAGSERETQTLMKIFQSYETEGFLDFHSRGKTLYYYRRAMPYTYNQRCRRYARRLQNLCGYSLGNKREELDSGLQGGNSVHFYSEYTGHPAITVETLPPDAEFPPSPAQQEEAYREIRALPLGMLEAFSSRGLPVLK